MGTCSPLPYFEKQQTFDSRYAMPKKAKKSQLIRCNALSPSFLCSGGDREIKSWITGLGTRGRASEWTEVRVTEEGKLCIHPKKVPIRRQVSSHSHQVCKSFPRSSLRLHQNIFTLGQQWYTDALDPCRSAQPKCPLVPRAFQCIDQSLIKLKRRKWNSGKNVRAGSFLLSRLVQWILGQISWSCVVLQRIVSYFKVRIERCCWWNRFKLVRIIRCCG